MAGLERNSRTSSKPPSSDKGNFGNPPKPIRLSGNLDGTPGAVLMGPRGVVELQEGVIRAAIHVHMGPADAAHYGVEHGDEMKLRVGGEAGLTFDRVRVRVGKDYRLDVHMDTDEANACGFHLTKDIELLK